MTSFYSQPSKINYVNSTFKVITSSWFEHFGDTSIVTANEIWNLVYLYVKLYRLGRKILWKIMTSFSIKYQPSYEMSFRAPMHLSKSQLHRWLLFLYDKCKGFYLKMKKFSELRVCQFVISINVTTLFSEKRSQSSFKDKKISPNHDHQ